MLIISMDNATKQCKTNFDKLFVHFYYKSEYDKIELMIKYKVKISFNVYWNILKESQIKEKKMYDLLITMPMPVTESLETSKEIIPHIKIAAVPAVQIMIQVNHKVIKLSYSIGEGTSINLGLLSNG
jgi:hypothetical protein